MNGGKWGVEKMMMIIIIIKRTNDETELVDS